MATIAATVLGLASLAVAIVAWRRPKSPSEADVPQSVPDHAQWRLVPVRECEPQYLGVHRSVVDRSESGSAELPSYVERDHDDALRRRIDAIKDHGGFVILLGGSSAGKSRSMFEALRNRLADWQLVKPLNAQVLRDATPQLPSQTVVWLDDTPVERYFSETGKGGLTADDVIALVNDPLRSVIIIDMWWPDRYQALRALPEQSANGPEPVIDRWREARDALALAGTPIEVKAALSNAERRRASVAAEHDPLVRQALRDTQFGFTQFLAGAPQLMRRWRDAEEGNPYAFAVISAGMDVTRLGLWSPLDVDSLKALAAPYLSSRKRPAASGDGFANALRYATAPLDGASSCLLPTVGTDVPVGEAARYSVADYLLQEGGRLRRYAPVPVGVWDILQELQLTVADIVRLADNARDRGLYQVAERFYRQAGNDPDAIIGLAKMLADQGCTDDAIEVLRAILASEDRNRAGYQLVKILASAGRLDKAIGEIHRQSDNDLFRWELPKLLAQRGRLDELRQLAASGDREARCQLIKYLAERGDEHDEDEVRSMADDDAGGQWDLIRMLRRKGRLSEAIIEQRELMRSGDQHARLRLAAMLAEEGQLPELRKVAADTDDTNIHWILAGALAEANLVDEAVAEWRGLQNLPRRGPTAAHTVDAWDHFEQGLVRHRRLEVLRELADELPRSVYSFAELLIDQGRFDDAVTDLREMAAGGHPSAARCLAKVLTDAGRADEVLDVVAQYEESDLSTDQWLADLMYKAGQESQLRAIAVAGNHNALTQLVELLEQRGCAEAAQVRRYGLNPDGSTCTPREPMAGLPE